MPETNSILRPPAVAAMLGVSRGTLRRWASTGLMPRPTAYGPRSLGWPANVIADWMKAREAAGGAR